MRQGATELLRPPLQQYSCGWYATQTAPCDDVSCRYKHGRASRKSSALRTSSVNTRAILDLGNGSLSASACFLQFAERDRFLRRDRRFSCYRPKLAPKQRLGRIQVLRA